MKLQELKQEIQKYQYMEDTGIVDISIASTLATRMQLGDPVWLVIIGASSGGKSQILRPISLTDQRFIHRVDDVTENTFLSGMKTNGESTSLLQRIGSRGMMVISDLTVLFSKSNESRATILSQFRMIYDGEMTKFSGNNPEPIKWKGHMGVIAGSTPSIYSFFEEVSDMGERFVYYRMKEYDPRVATKLALSRTIYGKELDDILSGLYGEYIKEVQLHAQDNNLNPIISPEIEERIIDIASFAERVRTPVHLDYKFERITKIPTPAMPMRVALQLKTLARSLALISHYERGNFTLTDDQMAIIDWCGYSLANEEKRAVLKVLARNGFDVSAGLSIISEGISLDHTTTLHILHNLTAVGVIKRIGASDNDAQWKIVDKKDYEIICRVENLDSPAEVELEF